MAEQTARSRFAAPDIAAAPICFPQRIALRPSRLLLVAIAVLHALAFAGLFLSQSLPIWLRIAFGIALGVSAVIAIRFHAARNAAESVRELTLLEDGSLEIGAGGRTLGASLAPQSIVFPGLVLLLPVVADSRRLPAVVLLPDALSAQDWRTLQTWMRWKAEPLS